MPRSGRRGDAVGAGAVRCKDNGQAFGWSRARRAAQLAAQLREVSRREPEDAHRTGHPGRPAVAREAAQLGEQLAGTAGSGRTRGITTSTATGAIAGPQTVA
jgi:hypothetical protein